MHTTPPSSPLPIQKSPWHTLTHAQAIAALHSHAERGLSEEDAMERLKTYGENRLQTGKKVSAWRLLLAQFQNVLVIILLIATALSGFLGEEVEAITIAAIVLLAVVLGFVQEYRAENAMEALKEMAAPNAKVIRGGREGQIPASGVVPGDVIVLSAGDRIPADARVLLEANLRTEEAALTGESLPSEKSMEAIAQEDAPVGDRRNMLYGGTTVSHGRGKAIVTATGMQTEFGKIAAMLQNVESEETPLQKNLDRVGKALAYLAFVVVTVISGIGWYRGDTLIDIFLFGIALAVAVVPEALPAVVTISLAIGVQRMVKRHALIRKLPAVETLGCTSVICTDKTGTLTKDEMTIRKIWVVGKLYDVSGAGYAHVGSFSENGTTIEPHDGLMELLRAGVLSSDARLIQEDNSFDIAGDPTEGALVVAAAKAELYRGDLEKKAPRIGEIPFTSETKRMVTLHDVDGGTIAYAKGAPEMLLPLCTRIWGAEAEEVLTDAKRTEILAAAEAMAGQALRGLAIARKGDTDLAGASAELKIIGLVGIIYPPRPEVRGAIRECHDAGIRVIMITGDHPVTAQAIARELGILKKERVVTGLELEKMDDQKLDRELKDIAVFARVSPGDKLRLVTALQKQGEVVAMTGDGVNDAPALKKADIGIAMGITGTDVTKEAYAMTLTDDNFASIVAAVEEGRGIFGNIKKYLMYLLSSNIGEIGLMTAATLMGVPLPLTAVQILYVNLATDGLPALALAVDPPERDLMLRAPRNPRRSIFTRPVLALMLSGGIWSALVNIGLFLWAMNSGRSLMEAMTMTFVSLVLIQFFKAYNFRSDRNSILRRPFANKWLNLAILWELLLLALVVYLPFLHKPFGTFSLPPVDVAIVVALAATISPVLELAKWMVRRGVFGSIV